MESQNNGSETFEIRSHRGNLPSDGYASAGRTLHIACRPTESSTDLHAPAIWRYSAIPAATGVGALGLIGFQTFSVGLVESLAGTVGLASGTGYGWKHYSRHRRAQRTPTMAVHLTNVAGTEHIYLHADDAHGVKSAYDQLHAPVVLNKEPTERMDLRDLIEQANPEATLQIAEYSVSATPQSDRLLTEESTCPGTGESTNLMIDLIRADLQAAEVDTGVQILIRGRESDESALQSKQQSIANGYDRGFYGNLKVESWQRINRALSDSSGGQNNRVESSETCNPEKRKKCKQTDGNNTFDIVVRMLACVPEGRALTEADYVFNTVGQRLEKATTDEIEIKKTVYTEGETNYVKRDFSTVCQQLLEREHYGGRGLLRTHIPRVTNTPEIVADSRTIWNWCLPTTETTESARRQTKPRDQNPTDRPPESVLDELTRDSDRSSRSNDDHHDSNA